MLLLLFSNNNKEYCWSWKHICRRIKYTILPWSIVCNGKEWWNSNSRSNSSNYCNHSIEIQIVNFIVSCQRDNNIIWYCITIIIIIVTSTTFKYSIEIQIIVIGTTFIVIEEWWIIIRIIWCCCITCITIIIKWWWIDIIIIWERWRYWDSSIEYSIKVRINIIFTGTTIVCSTSTVWYYCLRNFIGNSRTWFIWCTIICWW